MKKSLTLTLEDTDCIELIRILLDEDEQAALAFMKQHFKGKARELLGVSPKSFFDKKWVTTAKPWSKWPFFTLSCSNAFRPFTQRGVEK
jgi:hypothetical protein